MNKGSYEVGDVVGGTFRKHTPFGWFVELEHGDEALLHISEMPRDDTDAEPIDKFNVGDTGNFRVNEIIQRHGELIVSLSILGVEQPSSTPPA